MSNTNFFKLTTSILLLFSFFGKAQDTTLIKLKAALDTTRTATQKVDILIELVLIKAEHSIDSANIFLDSAEELATKINYTRGLAEAAKAHGFIYSMEGNYAPALRELSKAQTMFRQLNDTFKLAKTYMLLGNIYVATKNYNEALRYYNNAGNSFQELKEYKELAGVHNNIGVIYWQGGQLDSASIYFNKSLIIYLELNDKESLATSYTNIGVVYVEKDDYEKAIEYYTKSNLIITQLNQTYGEAINNLNISDAYLQMGRYNLAEKYIYKAVKIAEKEGYKSLLPDQYYTIGEIEEGKGDYKKALDWFRKSEKIEDSLFNTETNSAILEIQTEQLKEIQQREIERISEINKSSLKAEQLKNTLLLVISCFGLILLLVATTYFYKRANVAKQVNNQNLQILNQKSKIYQQAKSIADKNGALLDKNAKLEELNEEKNYIMNVVAHDLKSPLNQIQGLAEVIRLEEGSLTSTQKECLTNIFSSSERLSQMINRILNTRSIDAENADFQAANVKLVPILHRIIANFQPLADQKDIEVLIDGLTEKPVVKGDKHHIQQVIENILSNAIKFSPPSKKVKVNLKLEEKRVVLAFKDQGPGLTKEDHKKLFVEYANLSAKPTGDETSTGLGLSIVKKYIDLMGGEIWCESEVGKGTTFYLAFNLV